MAEVRIAEDWKAIIGEEFSKPYFEELISFVKQEYATSQIFPAGRNIFRAFDKCPFNKVKVVIIGQDPYHGDGQANGLCFSVNEGVPFPPSLKNIFKEVYDDVGTPIPTSGELDRWAEQGVLLLNSVLTVKAHNAASHAGRGWEIFTDAVVRAIAERKEGVVYMLWVATPSARVLSPTHRRTLSSTLSTHRHYPLTAASSAASTSLRQMNISDRLGRRRLCGR